MVEANPEKEADGDISTPSGQETLQQLLNARSDETAEQAAKIAIPTDLIQVNPLSNTPTSVNHSKVGTQAPPLEKNIALSQAQTSKTMPGYQRSKSSTSTASIMRSLSLQQTIERTGSVIMPDIPHCPKILIFIKPWDDSVFMNLIVLLNYMHGCEQKLGICVEIVLPEDLLAQIRNAIQNESISLLMEVNTVLTEEIKPEIDYIITLGGDGTLLWAAKQFNTCQIPPLITFAQGSLGFMCNFTFQDHEKVLTPILRGVQQGTAPEEIGLEKRLRLKVNVGHGTSALRQIYRGDQLQSSEPLMLKDLHVVNEVVIDRGPSPYTVQLNIYIDGNRITCSVGDGLIIATPTGSTAYNLAAGGSILETNTHCICLTPLAPHSLSFRPIILHASAEIRIEKVNDDRNSAWVALDGANRFELKGGESILISGSELPLTMCTLKSDNLTDLWAQRLVKFFGWNTREQNKPLQKKNTFYNPRKEKSPKRASEKQRMTVNTNETFFEHRASLTSFHTEVIQEMPDAESPSPLKPYSEANDPQEESKDQ